jgi:hypothetical protein
MQDTTYRKGIIIRLVSQIFIDFNMETANKSSPFSTGFSYRQGFEFAALVDNIRMIVQQAPRNIVFYEGSVLQIIRFLKAGLTVAVLVFR